MRLMALTLALLVAAYLCALDVAWVKRWGGPGVDDIDSVKFFDGYIYAAGASEAGGFDALLLKYDESGNLIWAVTWGTEGIEYARSLAVSRSGVYIAVWPSALLKFSHDGSLEWAADVGRILHVKALGDVIYAVGEFWTSFNISGVISKYLDRGRGIEPAYRYVTNWWRIFAFDVSNNTIYVAAPRVEQQRNCFNLAILVDRGGALDVNTARGYCLPDIYSHVEIYSLKAYSDGIYVAGYAYNRKSGTLDGFLAKLSLRGEPLWARVTPSVPIYDIYQEDGYLYAAGAAPLTHYGLLAVFTKDGRPAVGLSVDDGWFRAVDGGAGHIYLGGSGWRIYFTTPKVLNSTLNAAQPEDLKLERQEVPVKYLDIHETRQNISQIHPGGIDTLVVAIKTSPPQHKQGPKPPPHKQLPRRLPHKPQPPHSHINNPT